MFHIVRSSPSLFYIRIILKKETISWDRTIVVRYTVGLLDFPITRPNFLRVVPIAFYRNTVFFYRNLSKKEPGKKKKKLKSRVIVIWYIVDSLDLAITWSNLIRATRSLVFKRLSVHVSFNYFSSLFRKSKRRVAHYQQIKRLLFDTLSVLKILSLRCYMK